MKFDKICQKVNRTTVINSNKNEKISSAIHYELKLLYWSNGQKSNPNSEGSLFTCCDKS